MVTALALGLALPMLELLGFDPSGNNGPKEIQMLSYVYVLPPWLFYATAVLIIWRYPITSERLSRIRSAFDRRDERRSTNDTLGPASPPQAV